MGPDVRWSVPGFGWSVWSGLWALFPCVMQNAIICDFVCIFIVFSSYFWLVSLQSKNHQNSWNSLVITPTTTIDVHSSCLYAGVDGINFAVKDHQQRALSSCLPQHQATTSIRWFSTHCPASQQRVGHQWGHHGRVRGRNQKAREQVFSIGNPPRRPR